MKNWKLSKVFYFEAGHRLVKGYTGKCNNLHGHSWRLKVTVESDSLYEYDFVMDYKELKNIVSPIVDELDHSFLVYKKDYLILDFLKTNEFRHIIFDDNPTSEVIAKWIYDIIEIEMPVGTRISEVIINETVNSECQYS